MTSACKNRVIVSEKDESGYAFTKLYMSVIK